MQPRTSNVSLVDLFSARRAQALHAVVLGLKKHSTQKCIPRLESVLITFALKQGPRLQRRYFSKLRWCWIQTYIPSLIRSTKTAIATPAATFVRHLAQGCACLCLSSPCISLVSTRNAEGVHLLIEASMTQEPRSAWRRSQPAITWLCRTPAPRGAVGMNELEFTIKFSNSTTLAVLCTALSLQHERQYRFECLGTMPRDSTDSQTTPGRILTPNRR